MIEEARRAAFDLIASDPALARPEHRALAERAGQIAALATDLA
jgi:hypothetical protein